MESLSDNNLLKATANIDNKSQLHKDADTEEKLLGYKNNEVEENSKSKSSILTKIKGSLAIILAAFFLCLYSILVKLAFSLNAGDHAFIRYSIQTVVFLALCKWKKLKIFSHL